MNKKIIKILAVLIISVFLFPVFSQAQVKTTTSGKFRSPQVSVELLLNYSQPITHLFSDISRFFSFDGYGVKYGFGSELNVKLHADKKGRITPYATIGYNLFLGNADNAYIDSNVMHYYPLKGNAIYRPISGTSKMFIHDFNFGLGFSYTFVNKTRWTPFLGGDLDMHLLFGTYRQTPNSVVGVGNPSGEISYTIKQAVRFGFGVGGGVSLRVSRPVGFVFQAKYKFANVLGKESKISTDVNKFYLNDKADTGLNTNLVKDRQIDYLQFSLGIAFYIGRK